VVLARVASLTNPFIENLYTAGCLFFLAKGALTKTQRRKPFLLDLWFEIRIRIRQTRRKLSGSQTERQYLYSIPRIRVPLLCLFSPTASHTGVVFFIRTTDFFNALDHVRRFLLCCARPFILPTPLATPALLRLAHGSSPFPFTASSKSTKPSARVPACLMCPTWGNFCLQETVHGIHYSAS
jgi:hypothetical protein